MSVTITPKPTLAHDPRPDLRRKAEELEAAFLSEMLGHTGLGSASGPFGGGIGEQQFASFLRDEQATGMVRSGGIGLAEQFYRSLTKGMDDGL
ncbi:chemotaxis protein chel [Rhodobacter sphaeroides]|jgi:Rod binding protein.|uniref:Chemotactic signal-response protein CheL n=1 Tax=Cereibacter sphaeroides (strain ATCC 17023 / DSM 158 / JCM 6121 / CCUG 31486 / LMG 2827 / NBRC 12203 / NCIMB 8253 / ATH 2.4.1.) TaxID=272943 RepID=Q3IY69_CERS4|nr:rod-binding protein [Cereibacter sphaeroides]ABA80515.1 putative chemotactic signal-response protein CheL [Cereibacter sphaeroides 2.4.1]AMJ48744.1 chemotaxis protein chel [Cereibacter sphaeroides]ANS35459.1 chemotaxis protein chel [Cereibacter sphaeroides]ATN64512.1 chemotaxis protein chel [Cereibacter sphaeroides]AXC62700.1 chemotaxis protein chel [Cereibacter sphaeroides 2.4.1]